MSKQLIEQFDEFRERFGAGQTRGIDDATFLYQVRQQLEAYQAAAPIDVPPDEYDIVVDTGDGIYHTAELVHFQQEGSKRSIQVKLTYAEPTKEHPTIMAYPSGQIVMDSGELFVGRKYICIEEAFAKAYQAAMNEPELIDIGGVIYNKADLSEADLQYPTPLNIRAKPYQAAAPIESDK
jgi:hypothetical protein